MSEHRTHYSADDGRDRNPEMQGNAPGYSGRGLAGPVRRVPELPPQHVLSLLRTAQDDFVQHQTKCHWDHPRIHKCTCGLDGWQRAVNALRYEDTNAR